MTINKLGFSQCSACGGTTILVLAGASRIVSGGPLSELTSGEEGGGDDVWKEMDADMAAGEVDASCC